MIALSPTADPVSRDQLDLKRNELQALYRELDGELAEHAPVCELSGRCCRFQEYGHTLFLSEVEAELLIADAPAPPRALDDGQTCSWQDSQNRCTARAARPLGCRIFFCDPRLDEIIPQLSETYLGKLKQLTRQQGWAWNYAPLHQHLQVAQAQGRLRIAVVGSGGDPQENSSTGSLLQ